jgi:hypothetical protein
VGITDKPGSPADAVAELLHYGVLGMHWGVRKQRPVVSRVKRASAQRSPSSSSGHDAHMQARERGFRRIMLGLAVGGTLAYGALRLSRGGVNHETLKLAGLGARVVGRGVRYRAGHAVGRGLVRTQHGINQARLVGKGARIVGRAARNTFVAGYRAERARRSGG